MCLQQASDEETKAIRERVIELRRVIHQSTEEEVSKRWAFEEGVSKLAKSMHFPISSFNMGKEGGYNIIGLSNRFTSHKVLV